MASRWAYEALMVNQFVNNRYQKDFYDMEMLESNVTYDMQFLIPALIQEIRDALDSYSNDPAGDELKDRLETIRNGISSIFLTGSYPGFNNLYPGQFSESAGKDAIRWLEKYQDQSCHSPRTIVL